MTTYKSTDYARKCIRNGQLLEQILNGHRICVKYQNKNDVDQYTISWPKNMDKTFNTLNQVSIFHAKFVGMSNPQNAWKTFKINCWFEGSFYPSDSIEDLQPLPQYIIDKQEKYKKSAEEDEKKQKLKKIAKENEKTQKQKQKLTAIIIAKENEKKEKQISERPNSGAVASFLALQGLRLYSNNSCSGYIRISKTANKINLCSRSKCNCSK